MKEYYYLSGKDQNGPFSFDELKSKNLTEETLIWTEGMENWKKLKEEKEMYNMIFTKNLPPQPPQSEIEYKSNLDSSKEVIVEIGKSNERSKKIHKFTKWIIIWCSFHLFALLMSYSQIPIFNDNGIPSTDKLWPFVEYVNKHASFTKDNTKPKIEGYAFGKWESKFYGIFNEYDWTEFALYAGGGLVIFGLILITNRKEKVN